MINVYTDGAYKPSTNQGGYAAIILNDNNIIQILHEGYIDTTNNRMELLGVINALKYFHTPSTINIYSDSEYIVNNINNGHLEHWVKNQEHKLNWDLWEQLYQQISIHIVTFHWVKGHADCELNNLADLYANMSSIIINPIKDERAD